jgi:hypothetical protein
VFDVIREPAGIPSRSCVLGESPRRFERTASDPNLRVVDHLPSDDPEMFRGLMSLSFLAADGLLRRARLQRERAVEPLRLELLCAARSRAVYVARAGDRRVPKLRSDPCELCATSRAIRANVFLNEWNARLPPRSPTGGTFARAIAA